MTAKITMKTTEVTWRVCDDGVEMTGNDDHEKDGGQYNDDGDERLGMSHGDKNTTKSREEIKNSCDQTYNRGDEGEDDGDSPPSNKNSGRALKKQGGKKKWSKQL